MTNLELARDLVGEGEGPISSHALSTLRTALRHATRAAAELAKDPVLRDGAGDELGQIATLTRSVRHKQLLVEDVHHRVRNNLQIVSSLLYLQSRSVEDVASRAALLECRDRVHSMSLAHELLQESADGVSVEVGDYLGRLVDALRRAWVPDGRVLVVPRFSALQLDMDRAVCCGLVATELLTNAFRHAFPDHRPGAVCVELVVRGRDAVLSVRDDGVGLPAQREDHGSLGFQLIRSLARQLEGRVEVERDPGTTVRIAFVAPRA